MNETLNSLMNRRSVRDFQPAQIPDSDLSLIVDAGLRAASAMNQQPWRLTAVQSKDVIDGIVRFQRECLGADPRTADRHNFYHAPTVVFVSAAPDAAFGQNDCGNVCENMCVAAYSLGLGSCYIASFTHGLGDAQLDELRRVLEAPEGYRPVFAVALGYAKGPSPAAPELRKGTVNYIQ